MKLQIEGGSQAYCPSCQESGHYLTAHLARPADSRPWYLL